MHHQVNVHKDAHQWEERQSRDLWAESVHPWTHPRHLKGRPYPMWVGQVQCHSGCVFSAYLVHVKHWVWIREGSIGFSNSPSSLVQQRKLRPKARRPPSLKVDTLGTWGHLPWSEEQWGPGAASRWWPWPQWWAAAAAQPLWWARGLQRTPGWATGTRSGSGLSAGQLQGSRWRRTEQVRLQKPKMSRPWVTLLPKTSHIMKAHHTSSIPQLMKYTFPPYLVNFRIPPETDPSAHQALWHIHRQSGQMSGWGWCWQGTTDSWDSLRCWLRYRVQRPFFDYKLHLTFFLCFLVLA